MYSIIDDMRYFSFFVLYYILKIIAFDTFDLRRIGVGFVKQNVNKCIIRRGK